MVLPPPATLAEFIRARIDDDRAHVHRAIGADGGLLDMDHHLESDAARQVIYISPDRLLRECDAKLQLLRRLEAVMKSTEASAEVRRTARNAVWELAQVWDDHHHFSRRWRP